MSLQKSLVAIMLCAVIMSSCKNQEEKKSVQSSQEKNVVISIQKKKAVVIRELPHMGMGKYTQGFEFYQGYLFESTGLDEKSYLKKIDPQSGQIIMEKHLEDMFAEGITFFNDKIILLTYRRGIALLYNPENFEEEEIAFTYNSEGWGLTHNNSYLIMSDGSDKLYFRNPVTYKIEKTLSVRYDNSPVYYLNELEYVNGIIYANIYGEDFIVGIDENTGKVVEDIDCSSLFCAELAKTQPEDVVNGIAYNAETGTFFLTGKECDYIYEVKFQ